MKASPRPAAKSLPLQGFPAVFSMLSRIGFLTVNCGCGCLTVLGLTAGTCRGLSSENPPAPEGITVLYDVRYRKGPCKQSELDLAWKRDPDAKPRPGIVVTHGGDPWPDVYRVLLADGGMTSGVVYGASDTFGAYPAADPVTPTDLAVIVSWRSSLAPAIEIHDRTSRPLVFRPDTPAPSQRYNEKEEEQDTLPCGGRQNGDQPYKSRGHDDAVIKPGAAAHHERV
jgi:hypothetical protein